MSLTVRTRSIFALALVLLMAASTGTVAQEEAQDDSHPFIGAWLLDAGSGRNDALLVAGPGGTLINESQDGTGIGTWAPVDESSVNFTFHTPAGETLEDRFNHLFTIRGAVTVSSDGEMFDGTWTIQFQAEGQEEYGPGQVVGRRITAEDMGEPVGPM